MTASWPELATAVGPLAAVVVYGRGAQVLRRRGDAWPVPRQAAFVAAALLLTAAGLVPLPVGELTAHMCRHLIIGMAAPLLIALARPVTLALRTTPYRPRRLLVRLLHTRPLAWLTSPPVAAAVDVGSMWLLYRTPLFALTHERPWLHVLVHAHMLLAGTVFSMAICQQDPRRHPASYLNRATALVAAGAAHGILAKTLYIAPPPLTHASPVAAATAAEVMYYGGDLVEILLAAALALQWYAAAGRTLARTGRPTEARD